jgi:hypothetical protein
VASRGGWILASYACAPERAVGARALLFSSSKLKERLWNALENLERDAGVLHRGSLAAARVRPACTAAVCGSLCAAVESTPGWMVGASYQRWGFRWIEDGSRVDLTLFHKV